jgi:hypothetical protein
MISFGLWLINQRGFTILKVLPVGDCSMYTPAGKDSSDILSVWEFIATEYKRLPLTLYRKSSPDIGPEYTISFE